jgi:hypothetical protein
VGDSNPVNGDIDGVLGVRMQNPTPVTSPSSMMSVAASFSVYIASITSFRIYRERPVDRWTKVRTRNCVH